MAVASTTPTDPMAPRKLTPTGATLDPLQLQGPDSAPASQPAGTTPTAPAGTAASINQLPDGAGGAVTVPPPAMAPSFDQTVANQPVGGAGYTPMGQMAGPTDLMGRPLSADGTYHPFSGPTFTNDASGNVSTFQQPDGTWTQASGAALAPNTDQWGRSTLTGTGMAPSSTNGVANPAAGTALAPRPLNGLTPPSAPNINQIPGAPSTLPAPASAAGAAPNAPGASTFGADQNLINSQINPTPSARLLNVQGMGDAALNKVLNGPDRVALGQSMYDTFAKGAQNQFGHALTDATNKAAAHGQIGSGQLTNEYGDLTSQFNLANDTAASNFANQALQGTIGDNLNNLSAAQGYGNSLYGQEAAGRNEQRDERGYQESLAQQAIAQRIAQNQMEQGQQQQDFNQGATLFGLGNYGDPTNAYENAATLASSEAGANSQDVAALLRLYAQNRNPIPQSAYPTGAY